MAEVKYGHLEMALEIVKRVSGTPLKNHLLRLDLLKTKKALQGSLDSWLEVKAELVKEYGEEQPEGFMIDPKQENFPEFESKFNALVEESFEGTFIQMPDRLLEALELSVDDLELLDHCGLISLVEEAPPLAAVN